MIKYDELETVYEDWPRCAVCQQTVYKFQILFDPVSGNMKFVATCHGREQVVSVPEQILTESKLETMAFNEAFAVEELEW